MNVSDKSKFGCACCDYQQGTSKNRRRQGRTIKRKDRQNWKREVREM